jgi:hypothetical protein
MKVVMTQLIRALMWQVAACNLSLSSCEMTDNDEQRVLARYDLLYETLGVSNPNLNNDQIGEIVHDLTENQIKHALNEW